MRTSASQANKKGLTGVATCLLLLVVGPAMAQVSQIQSIPLYAGWNLISFQVNPSGFTPLQITEALGSDSSALVSVWGYDATIANWQVFQASHNMPTSATSLQTLYPGKGYWIKMTKGVLLQLTGSPWNGTTALVPGWNLVGFPGLTVGPSGRTDFASIFRGEAGKIPVIWSFQAGSQQKFVGYDTLALPAITDLEGVQPGQGYWAYSTANVTLNSTPVITLPPDSAAPRGPGDPPLPQPELFQVGDPRYVGHNAALYVNQLVRFTNSPADAAFDLNHNGILDSPTTQDTMFFPAGVYQQNITIFNTGAGLMNWYVAVPPGNTWLSVNPPSGAASTEQDTVQLTVNRSGLQPGFYTNGFTVYAGSITQAVVVILQVPSVAGDYAGYAITERVNGKTISIGKVDLSVSLFDDPSRGSNAFRGVINSDQSLLFPADVFMNGVFYQGLSFSLTTGFPMAPADRDAPPYTSFPTPNQQYQEDGNLRILPSVDVNQNGNLDLNNIFPFTIRRDVTLIGARTTADHLEGTYVESILGPLPKGQRINIEGTFVLDRRTLSPTLKSIYNVATNTSVIIGGSSSSSYTNSLTVGQDVQIRGVTVNLNFNFPDLTQLDVILYGPGGTNFYDFGTNVVALTSFVLTNFNSGSARGRWDLVVNWNQASGIHGYFNGWGLNLDGLAYYSVSGTVVDDNGQPISGATLALTGSNVLPQSNTSTNGTFSFGSLTENEYNLTVSKLGYATTTRSFNIDAADVVLDPPIVLTPIRAPIPILSAQPSLGQAPLNVNFTPIISTNTLATLGSNVFGYWSFGDGSPTLLATQVVALSHTYTNPGAFQTTLALLGQAGTALNSTNLVSEYITALAAQPNTNLPTSANLYVFGGGYIGSIAARTPTDLGSGSDILQSQISNTSSSLAVFQESKRDSAAFDIDRFPFTSPGQPLGPEDSDFYSTGVYSTNAVAPFRIISTIGGYVFPSETFPSADNSARQGEFVLQSGRVED